MHDDTDFIALSDFISELSGCAQEDGEENVYVDSCRISLPLEMRFGEDTSMGIVCAPPLRTETSIMPVLQTLTFKVELDAVG